MHIRHIFPAGAIPQAARRILHTLVVREADLVVETDLCDEVRAQWALVCAEVAYYCEDEVMVSFWTADGPSMEWPPSVRGLVWSTFLEKWRHCHSPELQTSMFLLSVPFQ